VKLAPERGQVQVVERAEEQVTASGVGGVGVKDPGAVAEENADARLQQLLAAFRGVPGITAVTAPQTRAGQVFLQGTLTSPPDSPAAYTTRTTFDLVREEHHRGSTLSKNHADLHAVHNSRRSADQTSAS
jgi:hypothetical protein